MQAFPPPAEAKADASPLPSPPFITTVTGLFNLRSLGSISLPSSPKTHINAYIYRSGDPAHLSPSSTTAFRDDLGIRTIFDLRSHGEVQQSLLAPVEGVENRHTPVYENRDLNPAEIAKTVAKYGDSEGVEGFVTSYVNILNVGANAFRAFFTHLLERRPSARDAVLVHCTAGKDRTGVAVALVLQLVGVGDEVVADEYALTDLGLREWREGVVKTLLGSPGLENDEVKIRRMLSARREVMLAFLERLRSDFGGAKGYLVEKLGFSEDQVERIKENVVQKDETEA